MNLKFYEELRSLLALKRCNPACPTRRLSSHKEPSEKDVEYNLGLQYYCSKAQVLFCSQCTTVWATKTPVSVAYFCCVDQCRST